MPPRVIPVRSSVDFNAFVDLPFELHAASPQWTPDLRSETVSLLTPGEHPFWACARRELFLALRQGRPVGRIAAIVDDKYNAYAGLACGAFGFFECEDDRETAHALLDAARDWLRGQGMTFMRGPLNPSTNYTCGLLVQGFHLPPTIMMPWNPTWYPELLESWHLRKEQDLLAYCIRREEFTPPEQLSAEVARLKAEARFSCRVSGKDTLAEDIAIMLDLYRDSWAENWGFAPLSPGEAERLVRELSAVMDPEFFVLFFHGREPAAGMVALPDMAPLLRKLKGRLGPTALWHWWRTRAQTRAGYRIILFGIRQEYRLLGLPLLLLDYLLEKAREHPRFQWVEGSWVLEDNVAVDELIEDFCGRLTKRYRIYRRDLES
ncbi:MAG: hypothetical protein IJU37_08190 [Desulfovibrio sp.]|nr:hypothetical protein [Desulfovibrio sp.]